ncbi:MAG: MBOAT family protein [Deltaproteobacteria bacterium]|nr:MBOAT family protein [Deltaproteobacteria bacterium]
MTFVQQEFLVFFALVLAVTWGMPLVGERRRVAQNAALLVASAVFYGWVEPWMLGLLLFSTVLDYGVTMGMARWPERRKALLALSLVGNLGMLGAFKYLGFFVQSVGDALGALGFVVHWPTLNIALPVGISFYTFQTLSYTLDVYRGKLTPRRSFLDVALFVSFFPQLVAGPVERARDLLPQLERPRQAAPSQLASGLSLALWGAVKKIVVADQVALYVDRCFVLNEPPPSVLFVASAAFAVQILADFSGYTDIARGTARMLGVNLTHNFNRPYLAESPSDFWRRWHISFSSWIHEYVYLPLCGGSGETRPSAARRTLATFGALLISGLWHGAAWKFVLWGAYHATLLTLWRGLSHVSPLSPPRLLRVGLMFTCTVFGWLLFRMQDVDTLRHVLQTAPWAGWSRAWPTVYALVGVIVAGGGVLALGGAIEARVSTIARSPWRPTVELCWWALAAALIFLMARSTQSDFLYFRF